MGRLSLLQYAEANVSHTAGYLIPRNKHLIVTDAQISAVGFQGILRIYEYDFSTSRIRGSIGDFRLSSNNLAQTFRLNGKIGEKKAIGRDRELYQPCSS